MDNAKGGTSSDVPALFEKSMAENKAIGFCQSDMKFSTNIIIIPCSMQYVKSPLLIQNKQKFVEKSPTS